QERRRSPTPLSSSAPANRSVHHAQSRYQRGPEDHLAGELPALEVLILRHNTRAAIRLFETTRLPNPDPLHKLATDPLGKPSDRLIQNRQVSQMHSALHTAGAGGLTPIRASRETNVGASSDVLTL